MLYVSLMTGLEYSMAKNETKQFGNSLAVQWLGLRASTVGRMGSIPGPGN